MKLLVRYFRAVAAEVILWSQIHWSNGCNINSDRWWV